MSIKYACFVSYRHGQPTLIEPFLDQLVGAINGELEPYTNLRCFVDKQRLRGGTFYNEALAEALCQSACMIAVYTPIYFNQEHPYCAREFRAMEQLEQERLTALGENADHEGLIIPVVPRGLASLPNYVSGRRNYIDFESFQLGDPPLNQHPNFSKVTRDLANSVRQKCELLSRVESLFTACASFRLPSEAAIRDWLSEVVAEPLGLPT